MSVIFIAVSVLCFWLWVESETALTNENGCQVKRYDGSCLSLEAKVIDRDCEPSKPTKTIREKSVPLGSPRMLAYNRTSRVVSWKLNFVKIKDTGFFMLKITFEEDRYKTSKLLLLDFTNISISRKDHDTMVSLPIDRYFPAKVTLSGLEFTLWALPKTRLSKCPGNKIRPKLKYSPPAYSWCNLDKAYEQLLRDANNCMCNTKVTYSASSDRDRRSVYVTMTVENLPSRGKIQVTLESRTDPVTLQTFIVRGTSTGRKFAKVIYVATPSFGYFRITADVICLPEYERFVTCDGPYMEYILYGPDDYSNKWQTRVKVDDTSTDISTVASDSNLVSPRWTLSASVAISSSKPFHPREECILLSVLVAVGTALLL